MSSGIKREEVFPIFTAPPAVRARKSYVVKLVSTYSKPSTEVKLTAPTVVNNSQRGAEKPKGREERKARQQENQIEGDDESKTSQWKLEDPHPLKNKRFTGSVESEVDGQTQYLLLELDEKTNSLNVIRPVHLHMVPDLSLRAPPPPSLEAAEELNKQREKMINASLKPQTSALKKLSDLVHAAQVEAIAEKAEGPSDVTVEQSRKLAKRKQEIEDSAGRSVASVKSKGNKTYEWKRQDNDEELGADDDVLDEYEADAVDPYELAKQEEAAKRRQERAQKMFFESAGRISGMDAELLNDDDGIEDVEEEERAKRGRGEEGEGEGEGDDDDDDDEGDDDDEEDFEDDDDDVGTRQTTSRTKRVRLSSAAAGSSSSTSSSAPPAPGPSLMGMIDTAAFNPKLVVIDAFKRAANARGVSVLDLWIPFTELRAFLVGASTFDDEKKNAIKNILPTVCRRDDQKPPNLQLLPSAL